mmetsp:Transcript_18905/g.38827  ORF Transcript_18905/g.38827 Transcript_18905/m.38827 type:complete len:300 (+) Transcript_18905:843-1742(+)
MAQTRSAHRSREISKRSCLFPLAGKPQPVRGPSRSSFIDLRKLQRSNVQLWRHQRRHGNRRTPRRQRNRRAKRQKRTDHNAARSRRCVGCRSPLGQPRSSSSCRSRRPARGISGPRHRQRVQRQLLCFERRNHNPDHSRNPQGRNNIWVRRRRAPRVLLGGREGWPRLSVVFQRRYHHSVFVGDDGNGRISRHQRAHVPFGRFLRGWQLRGTNVRGTGGTIVRYKIERSSRIDRRVCRCARKERQLRIHGTNKRHQGIDARASGERQKLEGIEQQEGRLNSPTADRKSGWFGRKLRSRQ